MNAFDRRRVVVACVLTLVALSTLWVFSHNSAASSSNGAGGGLPLPTVPPTTAYRPSPPLFVGGDPNPVQPGVVPIAVPPAPGPNDVLAKASFHRYVGLVGFSCTTALAPDGATMTITNVDNGQKIVCTNTTQAGVVIPAGTDLVIDTALYVSIGDLADAPLSVRVSW